MTPMLFRLTHGWLTHSICAYTPFECETCTGEIDGTGTVVDNDGGQ